MIRMCFNHCIQKLLNIIGLVEHKQTQNPSNHPDYFPYFPHIFFIVFGNNIPSIPHELIVKQHLLYYQLEQQFQVLRNKHNVDKKSICHFAKVFSFWTTGTPSSFTVFLTQQSLIHCSFAVFNRECNQTTKACFIPHETGTNNYAQFCSVLPLHDHHVYINNC